MPAGTFGREIEIAFPIPILIETDELFDKLTDRLIADTFPLGMVITFVAMINFA